MTNRTTQTALSISLLYVCFATLWVYFSDRLLELFISDPNQLIPLGTYKGWAFVVVSALLLYTLLYREFRRNKWAYAALQETQRRHVTLLGNLPGMVYRCHNDRNWTMIFVSEGCVELTGYQPDDLIDSHTIAYGQCIHPDDKEWVADHIAAALKRHEPFQVTYRIRTASGQQKWAWEQGCGVFSPEGDLLSLEGFIADFTAQKEASQELEQRVAERTYEVSTLYQGTQQRLHEIESLQHVTSALLQTLTLEEIFEIICHEAQALSGASAAMIRLLQEENWLQVIHHTGNYTTEIDRLPIDNSFAGLAVRQKRPMFTNDPANSIQRFPPNALVQSLLVYPLVINGTVLGTLHVINRPDGFRSDNIRVLKLLADQAAIAIENARLYEQAEGRAVLAERHRLARELHDSVTQSIYSVILFADAAHLALTAQKTAVATDNLREARQMAGTAIADMRLLLYELHPPELAEEGLVSALHTRLDAVESRAGLHVDLNVSGEVDLPLELESELYKIAQEVLNNVIKHANANTIIIQIDCSDERYCIIIQDDGIIFNTEVAKSSAGLGLRSIAERVQQCAGELSIQSASGEGTVVQVAVDRKQGEKSQHAQRDSSAHR